MRPLAEGFPRFRVEQPARARRAKQRLAARCDTLFSQLVRRHGFCVECGSTRELECAHGFGRGHRATRWDFRNAFCLCHRCHAHFTDHHEDWQRWMVARLGCEFYLELRSKALGGVAEPIDDVWARLRELERRAA